jgi:hypothetical protein
MADTAVYLRMNPEVVDLIDKYLLERNKTAGEKLSRARYLTELALMHLSENGECDTEFKARMEERLATQHPGRPQAPESLAAQKRAARLGQEKREREEFEYYSNLSKAQSDALVRGWQLGKPLPRGLKVYPDNDE